MVGGKGEGIPKGDGELWYPIFGVLLITVTWLGSGVVL